MEKSEKVLSEEEQKLENEKTYDSSLAAMVVRLEEYVVPLINELFGENFSEKTRIRIRNVKHVLLQENGSLRRRDVDAIVELYEQIGDEVLRLYHFECETWLDNSVLIRVAEYGSAIAIANIKLTPRGVTLTFPNSGIIFLRPNGNIPQDFMITHKVPQGGEVSYRVPVIQISDYSIDTLFERKLLILLPFYFFRHVNEFSRMNTDKDLWNEMERELNDINTRLEELREQNKITTYQKRLVQELLQRVTDSLTVKFRNVREGVDKIMSGYIARTQADEILEQGINQGITLGISRGKEEGRKEGKEEGRKEGKEEGRKEGRKEGKAIGEEELANALDYLYQNNRGDEAREAVRDKAVRARILKEYRCIEPVAETDYVGE